MFGKEIFGLCVFIAILGFSLCKPSELSRGKLEIVTRAEWGAKEPTSIQPMETPVPFVVIHHSSIPEACFNQKDCARAMRSMQYMHQIVNLWADIGYNFAVGSDGVVYEGRGWQCVGAHAPGYNTQSIGIVLIGHWVSDLPPEAQLKATKDLISEGISQGYIQPNYSLVGHRQVRATECPGDALYDEIESWRHFEPAIQME